MTNHVATKWAPILNTTRFQQQQTSPTTKQKQFYSIESLVQSQFSTKTRNVRSKGKKEKHTDHEQEPQFFKRPVSSTTNFSTFTQSQAPFDRNSEPNHAP
ncbi:hypothetical protein M758_3G097300 [Ceratodon purpureus]|nr:hypothetical protein M758_3G097300 [Ceratodon purpureus]